MEQILIPNGFFSNSDTDTNDDEAAKRRKEIREKLLKGEEVKVTPEGIVKDVKESKDQEGIIVPKGKLANFYWYENDPQLFEKEKQAMSKYFPQFKLEKLKDGRLSWTGIMKTDLRAGGIWCLQAIYDNNHPNNSTFGGSVKIYSIEPDLEEISSKLNEPIPHLLKDSKGHVFLCTARIEDVGNPKYRATSAASSLSWAAKWIAAFELWMANSISTLQFSGHQI
jgi:hypothetical protein